MGYFEKPLETAYFGGKLRDVYDYMLEHNQDY